MLEHFQVDCWVGYHWNCFSCSCQCYHPREDYSHYLSSFHPEDVHLTATLSVCYGTCYCWSSRFCGSFLPMIDRYIFLICQFNNHNFRFFKYHQQPKWTTFSDITFDYLRQRRRKLLPARSDNAWISASTFDWNRIWPCTLEQWYASWSVTSCLFEASQRRLKLPTMRWKLQQSRGYAIISWTISKGV